MAKSGGKGINLKDKLDGNELDLSLCDLNEVPVKELAGLPKATVLDLSCNNLATLPAEFCSLTHLVKLDLSKNRLQNLPSDFGRLINLQHLDLLNNRLATLPVSFAQLKNLKWLDLKDNPLDPTLAKIAGDCLDEKQCKLAAVRNKHQDICVLQHMTVLQSELDRERQRKLQKEQELEKKREAERQAREAQERELRKREKAEEKERRRKEYDDLRIAKQKMTAQQRRETGENQKPSVSHPSHPLKKERSWSRVLLKMFLLLLLGALSTLAVCRLTELQHQPVCVSVNTLYEDALTFLPSREIFRNILQPNSQQ